MKHKIIVEYFKALSQTEQKQVVRSLLKHLTSTETSIFSSRQNHVTKTGLTCPSCNSKSIVGYGKYKDARNLSST